MSPISIAELKQHSGENRLAASVLAQLQSRRDRVTKNNKPYLDLSFADATDTFQLKIWSDAEVFAEAGRLEEAVILWLDAEWTNGTYGVEAAKLAFRPASEAERALFFSGDEQTRLKQERDYADIEALCGTLVDPRFHALCRNFLETFGARFRRAAAARRNHHARRGGLVEHVAAMMRAADALCRVYPELNRDLLLTGTLLHDVGKLWENNYPETGFNQQYTRAGELLGHIPLGIELANNLFRRVLESPEAAAWQGARPGDEECRMHLLHLIASHHGEYEFGSPTLPRTPEAFALHHIDNLDAKLEMLRQCHAQGQEVAPGIYEKAFPLPGHPVRPLAGHQPAASEPAVQGGQTLGGGDGVAVQPGGDPAAPVEAAAEEDGHRDPVADQRA